MHRDPVEALPHDGGHGRWCGSLRSPTRSMITFGRMPTGKKITIDRATLLYLRDLERNNDRTWFEAHKDRYLAAHGNMVTWADGLLARMNAADRISTESGKASLMRIHQDQRFHKGRPPYAPRFGGRLARVKPALRGGYFFRIQHGDRSHITCGFMGPGPDDLKLIRQDIVFDHATWRRLLRGKNLHTHWGELFGEELATAPRGFPKDHAAMDLLRKKQFLLRRTFTDGEVLAPGFMDEVVKTYRAVRPWFDHMSALLTSDANGA